MTLIDLLHENEMTQNAELLTNELSEPEVSFPNHYHNMKKQKPRAAGLCAKSYLRHNNYTGISTFDIMYQLEL